MITNSRGYQARLANARNAAVHAESLRFLMTELMVNREMSLAESARYLNEHRFAPSTRGWNGRIESKQVARLAVRLGLHEIRPSAS